MPLTSSRDRTEGSRFFRWRFNDLEQMPAALHDMKVERLDGAVTDAHGVGLPFVDVLAMNEIPLKFLLGDLVRRHAVEEFNELANMPGICFLSAFSFAVEFQGFNGFAVPWGLQYCHNITPFFWGLKRFIRSAIMAVVKKESLKKTG